MTLPFLCHDFAQATMWFDWSVLCFFCNYPTTSVTCLVDVSNSVILSKLSEIKLLFSVSVVFIKLDLCWCDSQGTERWTSKSSLLQVLISIQGLCVRTVVMPLLVSAAQKCYIYLFICSERLQVQWHTVFNQILLPYTQTLYFYKTDLQSDPSGKLSPDFISLLPSLLTHQNVPLMYSTHFLSFGSFGLVSPEYLTCSIVVALTVLDVF